MILTENREKVKRNIKNLINKGFNKLNKPEKKFILEMISGMLISGSCNITEIARNLKEKISIKDTSKRLHRMLSHESIKENIDIHTLNQSQKYIDENTILALDGGDIVHQYGECFEEINYVHDGSTKKLEKGYWLNQITGYDPGMKSSFPVLLDMYSCSLKSFKSANNECLSMVSKLVERVGNKGLWVMDRGYDNGIIMDYFLKNSLDFLIRMTVCRNLLVRNKSINIDAIGKKINRRIKFSSNARFGSKKLHILIGKKKHEVTLISYKDKRNKKAALWLTNGWVKSTKELKRRIRGYFRRWSVEEAFRFEKQGFGIESSTVRTYKKIKTLTSLTVLCWSILCSLKDIPKIKQELLKCAKMEKTKKKHEPKFIYYRLLKGIQNLFKEAKELFRFREKKIIKSKILQFIKNKGTLFPDLYMKVSGWEF